MSVDIALKRLALHQPDDQICLLNQSLTDKYLEYVGTESAECPLKSPDIQEIILSNQIGQIAAVLSKRLNIDPVRALELFYASKTCIDLHDKSTGL